MFGPPAEVVLLSKPSSGESGATVGPAHASCSSPIKFQKRSLILTNLPESQFACKGCQTTNFAVRITFNLRNFLAAVEEPPWCQPLICVLNSVFSSLFVTVAAP